MTPRSKLRRRIALVLVAAFTALFAGCGLGGDDEDSADAGDGPITIGGALSLTGPFADTGRYIRDGYEDWAKRLNDQGGLLGRKVELEILDDTSEPARAATLLQKLITQDGVDLVLGGYPGANAAAQMAVAEQNQKVYVSMGGHMGSFEQDFEYSFGAPPLMGEWWYQGFFDYLETLPESERPTKAALVTVNNPVGAAVLSGTVDGLERLGIEIVVNDRYDLPLPSADALVAKVKGSGADLFVANSFFDDGVRIVRAMNAQDYRPRAVLEGVGTLIPSWREELGKEGDGVFSGTVMHPKLPYTNVDVLNEMAAERYGTPVAPIYYMFGATWLDVLAQGVKGVGSLEDSAIRDWLKANPVKTPAGELRFDERGLPEQFGYLTQVQDGAARLVWPEDVAEAKPVYPLRAP